MTETTKLPVLQYIKLTRPIEFKESPGRYTYLIKDAPGFFIDEDNIEYLFGFTKEKKEILLKCLKESREDNQYLALVAGCPIIISEKDFIKTECPKITPVPTGLVCGDGCRGE